MRRRVLLVAVAAVMLLSVALTGCAQKAEQATIRDLPAEFDWLEGLAVKDDGTPLRVHYLANYMFADWPVVNANLTKSLIERGGGECTIHDSNMDVAVELSTVESLISQGEVDVFISHTSDSQGVMVATEMAVDAGIPWFAVDMINNSPNISGYIGVDGQESLGGPAAEAMLEFFDGAPIELLIMVGKPGAGISEGRERGILAAIEGHDEITVHYTSPTMADIQLNMNATVDGLQAHPGINAIIYYQSGMDGIFRGLEQMDRLIPRGEPGHISVYGVDGTPSELEEMRNGFLDGVTEHHGGLVAELAVKAVLAEVILGQDVENVVFMAKKVTPATVDDPSNFGNLPRDNWDDYPQFDPDGEWFAVPHR